MFMSIPRINFPLIVGKNLTARLCILSFLLPTNKSEVVPPFRSRLTTIGTEYKNFASGDCAAVGKSSD